MMLGEQQLRTRIKELDKQGHQYGDFATKLLVIRNNQTLAFGDPDKVREIVAGLVELKVLVGNHRRIVEATASVQPYARDKTNPSVLGLLGNVKGKSRELLSRLDGLLSQIQELIRTAGSGNSSAHSRLTIALARHLDNKFDATSNKVELGGPDGLLIAILILVAAVKEWVQPSEN